jgi:hypothetical protein
MNENNLIYGLRDPRNDVYRYVGKTTVGYGRPLKHLTKSHNKLVNKWVESLASMGMEPLVDVIEENIDIDELSGKELYYISKYSDLGVPLFNGGESMVDTIAGGMFDVNLSKEIMISMINSSSIVASVKLKMSLSDGQLSNIIDLTRSTLSRIKKGEMSVGMNYIIKLHILNVYGFQDMFDYYYSISHDYRGDYPDDIASFIVKVKDDSWFAKTICHRYFKHKVEKLTGPKPKQKRFR